MIKIITKRLFFVHSVASEGVDDFLAGLTSTQSRRTKDNNFKATKDEALKLEDNKEN